MTEADKPAAQPSVRMPDSADFNAIVALGANIGDKVANVERARGLLTTAGDGRVELIGSSRIYKTPPWGITDQDWFVNSCISVRTDLDPNTLLRRCLDVEEAMGRRRTEKWGPRLIDLDVLVYEDRQIETEDLMIPHPHITERAFVLVPLCDIAPKLVLKGRTVDEWAGAVDATGIEAFVARSQ